MPRFVVDRNNKNRRIYHSANCTWEQGKTRLSNNNVCLACDVLRTYKAKMDIIPESAFGLGSNLKTSIYCVNANIPYARCTKHTNPRCGCGKLVYYKKRIVGFGELF